MNSLRCDPGSCYRVTGPVSRGRRILPFLLPDSLREVSNQRHSNVHDGLDGRGFPPYPPGYGGHGRRTSPMSLEFTGGYSARLDYAGPVWHLVKDLDRPLNLQRIEPRGLQSDLHSAPKKG